jgi:hypothetical protein
VGSRHDKVNEISQIPNPSGHTRPLGFARPLTEMSTGSMKIMFLGSLTIL